ncbi:MAG TPA: DUF1206 domain-containing protein [Anditalea sp.]|nr:DUF1206 domain-containing protein [Anditalea sp.]
MSESKKEKFFVHYLPMYGSISTGIIYVAIGVIALLSLFELKDGGADESSLLEMLDEFFVGQLVVGIILTGTIGFIVWRIYEAYVDPYNYGSNYIGIGRRIGIALSSVADAFIAYSAIMVLFGTTGIREDGEPDEEREMVSDVLEMASGDLLIISLGVIVMLTAIVQFYYGVTNGYRERLDIAHFSKPIKKVMHILADTGYFARGIIIGIIGFFYIKAGIENDQEMVVNTDKAFDFLGSIWHPLFAVVALGTISYGLFMFAQGMTYDVDNDEDAKDYEK